MTEEKKYKLLHDRPTCIGCAACPAVAPDFWEMTEDGLKSDIKGGKNLDNEWQELEIEEKDVEVNKEAAECCPVDCIHIEDKEGKRII
ncbi:ferredoxin [archaeon]|nr:ferredoxin [archaeon]|tara:strand:- start:3198 stop:3461 length:264 start_codon:yes stop_codon:yes gene_type:complete